MNSYTINQKPRESLNSQENNNIIVFLWVKYFPYWPIFIVLIILAISGVWLYLRFKLPVYESTATLLINDEKKGIEGSKMMESLNPLSSKKIIENEIEVIKSRALIKQVIIDLGLYAPIYKEAIWKDISAYSISPIKIEVRHPDALIEVKKVNFRYNSAEGTVHFNGNNYALDKWITTPWGEFRVTSNNKHNHNGVFYFALINPKRIVNILNKSIDVAAVGKLSSVVNLKIRDEDPKRSEDILNKLIEAYSKAAINDKNLLANNALVFLNERLESVAKDLSSVEEKTERYRARYGAIDISSQGKLLLQNLSINDQKISDTNIKLAVLEQVEQYIISRNIQNSFVPSTIGIDDPVLTELLNKLYNIELQNDKLKLTTGENNPDMVSLSDQIRKLKSNILENVHNQQKSLNVGKNNLNLTNRNYNTLLQALPQRERDLLEINREQNIKSGIYSFLLQKREEAVLAHSSKISNSKIIDKAESSIDPVGVSSSLIYGVAVFFALGLGITLITGREVLSRKLLFRHELEAITTAPVIGEISQERTVSPLVLNEDKNSFSAEQFRLLRTSLSYLGIGAKGKKVLITSTISGEGKSFIAVNLALSLALAGKKVILVEFDLSNPTLEKKLNMDKKAGVADYLRESVELESIINKTRVNKNLYLIPAGNLPNNPSELILHHRTTDLLNYLEEHFDYVLIDCAPIGLLSDGYVLSNYCDATLYIVRHYFTPKIMIEQLERNNINKLRNLAIVFNGVRTRGFGKNSYGYGYSCGYQQEKYF